MTVNAKELAKCRTECAEKEATIAAMKIDIQTLNKAIEEAKNQVQNSEEEVIDCPNLHQPVNCKSLQTRFGKRNFPCIDVNTTDCRHVDQRSTALEQVTVLTGFLIFGWQIRYMSLLLIGIVPRSRGENNRENST